MRTGRLEANDGARQDSAPSVAMRGGLCGVFLDFDLLPRLLARAETAGGRANTVADWSALLDQAGFKESHIDPDELPAGMSSADRAAADAWRFAERIGLVDPGGPTADGRETAALAEMDREQRHEVLAPMLAERVERRLRGQGNVSIVDLLRRAAGRLEKTTNLWAHECPGLIPVEVGAIVHWASVNARRAIELVDNIVSWRDVAMHRHPAPVPSVPTGAHAQLHLERVSEFYGEHPWLGERVPWSLGEDLALCGLLVYCGLFRGVCKAPFASCLVSIPHGSVAA